MTTPIITEYALKRLQDRAAQANCSADDLLNRLLEIDSSKDEHAKATLQESETRYRILTELTSDYAMSVAVKPHQQYEVEWIVGAFEEITGYPTDHYLSSPPQMFTHPEDLERVMIDITRTTQGKRTNTEYRILHKDGSIVWVRNSRMPVWDDKHERVIRFHVSAQNITQRKQVEEALRTSEERYRTVSELISEYAYSYRVDPDGQIFNEWITDSYVFITGYRLEETDAPAPYGLYHAGDKERARLDVERVINGEELTGEYRIITKSGDMRWMRISRRPVWDENKTTVLRFYGIAQDITAEKQAEQAALEEQRLRTSLHKEKELNTLMQRMVSSLSHDIRTPLAIIATAKDMLSQYFDRMTEEKRREKLATIDKQLRFVLEILDDLTLAVQTKFTQRAFQKSRVDIDTLCQLTIDEIYSVNAAMPHIHFINASSVKFIDGDETLVSRILLNLLANAVKFSPIDSEVLLELKQSDNWLILIVADQGMGISEADQQYIFEPLYRASNAQGIPGTGLGLNIVKESVELHHGRISVESQIGKGTTFVIELPITADRLI